MTESKRFTLLNGVKLGTHSMIWDNLKQHNQGIGDELWLGEVVGMLNEGVMIAEENKKLKQQIKEVKNDEKQLGISFMDFKMKLINILQEHYNYANEQRQKNLDNPVVTQAYDVIRYDVRHIAEEMGVDLE